MAYYDELNKIINNVISEKILTNQKICKSLYYYPEDNSFSYDPLNQPDIEDTSKLLMKYIYPIPKMPDTNTEQKGYLTVTLNGGNRSNNQGYRNIHLIFNIIVNLNAWYIKEGLRPYVIASEIDKLFNNQQTDLPIENKPTDLPFEEMYYANLFYGLKLTYVFSIDSNIGNMPNYKVQTIEPITVPSFIPKNLGIR